MSIGGPVARQDGNALKTTDLAGNAIDIKQAALQSFGKAFLLPIEVIVGWIFTNEKRQRVFERASDTIVIKTKDIPAHDLEYRKA